MNTFVNEKVIKTNCLLSDSWCGKSGCFPRECGRHVLLLSCSSLFVHWRTFYAYNTTLCILHAALCLLHNITSISSFQQSSLQTNAAYGLPGVHGTLPRFIWKKCCFAQADILVETSQQVHH